MSIAKIAQIEILQLQQFALENMSEAVFLIDEHAQFHYVNQAACSHLGYTKEELLTMSIFDVDSATSRDEVQKILQENKISKNILFESQHKTKDGKIIPVEINTNHFDYNGIYYTMSFVKDITERKSIEKDAKQRTTQLEKTLFDLRVKKQKLQLSQQALQEMQTKLSSIINTFPDLLWLKDTEGFYLVCNSAFEHYCGKPQSEVIGKTDYDFFTREEADICKQSDKNVLASNTLTITKEEFTYSHDKTIGMFEVRKSPIYKSNGELLGLLGIGRDITKNNNIKKQLLQEIEFSQGIINAIPDLLFEISQDGKYLGIWARDAHFLSAQKELLLGKNIRDILTEDALEVALKTMQEVDNNGSSIGNSYKLNLADGERWFELSATKKESCETYLASVRDITDRKQTENALIEKNIQYNQILDNSFDVICLIEVTNDGRFIHLDVNRAFSEATNMPKEAIVGHYIDEMENKECSNILIDKYSSCVKKGAKTDYIAEHNLPIGRRILHSTLSPIFDDNGRIYQIVGVTRDITDIYYMQDALEKNRASLAEAQRVSHTGSWELNMETDILSWSDETFRIFEIDKNEFSASYEGFLQIIHPHDRDMVNRAFTESLTKQTHYEIEHRLLMPDGRIKHVLERGETQYTHEGKPLYTFGIIHDISKRKSLEIELKENEKRLKEAQKIAKLGSWELEFPTMKFLWSDEVYNIFETNTQEREPSYDYFLNSIHPEDRDFVDATYSESLKNKTAYDIVHRLLLSKDNIKYINVKGKTSHNIKENILRFTGTMQDITEQKMIEKKIEYAEHHDPLTGLPNTLLAKEITKNAITFAKRYTSKIALLFLDLDGFKTINDSMGHAIGDEILKIVASRMKNTLRECDTISRQGGDEFLIILSNINDLQEITTVIEKLLYKFEKPFDINGYAITISTSIGIAVYPEDGDTFESLLQSADAAMYKAKENGKNTNCFYTREMNQNIENRFQIQNDLKHALLNHEFILYYQPQIDLSQNRIIGAEALIRWMHPKLGMIPPMDFIPIAESNGFIVQIGEWVIQEACRELALWDKQGCDVTIAVNVSSVQFKRGNFEAVVKKALDSSGVNPQFLELELTESILINDVENVLKTIQALKGLGIKLSIDDFGTGYSSLSYLKRFAVDKIKIDQSFIRGILEDKEDSDIVQTIIQIAKNFNLKTIAEGVETKEVLDIVEFLGCDEVQGYYFAKPMQAREFKDYYDSYKNTKRN